MPGAAVSKIYNEMLLLGRGFLRADEFLAHRDKFLRGTGVNPDGLVEHAL